MGKDINTDILRGLVDLYLKDQILFSSIYLPKTIEFPTIWLYFWGTRWRSWLRHWSTSRKVAGSIPDGVIGIFQLHNPSGRTMALGSTQSPTEMTTRDVSLGGKDGRCVRLTTLPPSCADF